MRGSMDVSKHIYTSETLQSIVNEALVFFVGTPVLSLPPEKKFWGGGVYALYYHGDFEPYRKLVQANKEQFNIPIYVGKAVPSGWRTARIQKSNSPDLFRRLSEHAKSIDQTNNLKLRDFKCRFMILDGTVGDIVVPVEAELIRRFIPIWNNLIDGFGNHDPGSGRYNQAKSEWDVLHAGRYWADRLLGTPPKLEDIYKKLKVWTNPY